MENRHLLNRANQLLPAVYIVAAAVIMRIIPHPANIAPVGAIALFAGSYLSGSTAFVLPLVIMAVSDLFLGLHATIPFVYGAFAVSVLIGRAVRNRGTGALAAGCLGSAVLFFLVTNFGVWAATPMYPKTLAGLYQAYLMGLPFFRNTAIGDIIYTSVFFGGYAVLVRLAAEPALKRVLR